MQELAIYTMDKKRTNSVKRASRAGRPTKYGKRVTKLICDAISEGVPFSHASSIGGISYETFCQWRRKYPEFSDAVAKALANGIRSRLNLINKAAQKGNVAAAKWLLERVAPDHFSGNRVEMNHKLEGSLEHSMAIPTEVLDALAKARNEHVCK